MKHLYRTVAVLLVAMSALFNPLTAQGQAKPTVQNNDGYSWEFGAGVGFTNYYGDVSNYRILNLKDLYKVYKFADLNPRYTHTPSFSLLARKKLNRSIGVLIQANALQFGMSDRFRKKNGSVDTDAMNYERALNFRTNLQDLGVALTFNSNNGGLFKEEAVFYPSFYVGMGISHFSVKGDLYDGNNAQYDYTLPGYINDGDYETDLRKLNTETSERYNNVVPFLNLGLALNFTITDFLKLAVQSDIKYSGSDYLDDVSKTYKTSYASATSAYAAKPGTNIIDPVSRKRGDNNGVNDIYVNNRLVIFYTLHPKKKSKPFKAPVIYSIMRADTSKSMSYRKLPVRDTLPVKNKVTVIIDTVLVTDSASNLSRLIAADTAYKSGIDNKLSSIQQELQSIKTVMRNQAIISRYRYLQYQADSVSRLSNAIGSKRTVTATDRLQQRVFALQQDSLRNEMQTLLWISQYPAKGIDSAALNFDPSVQPVFIPQASPPVIIYDTVIAETSEIRGGQPLAAGTKVFIDTVRRDTGLLRQRATAYSFKDYTDSINRTNAAATSDQVNDELTELKSQERYQKDSAYRNRIDSLEKRLKSYEQTSLRSSSKQQDSINSITRSRISRMQARIDSLERLKNTTDTVYTPATVNTKTIRSTDTVYNDTSRLRAEANQATEPSQTFNNATDTLVSAQLQRRLRANSDSLAMMQQSLRASRDSASYYRRTLYAMDLTEEDTVVEKRKWYQKILPKSRKEKVAEKESVEASSLKTQEQYYDEQTRKMNNDIEKLQRDNRTLQSDYDRLDRRRDSRSVERAPTVVLSGDGNNNNDNDREVRRLRDDIGELKAQLAASTALTTTTTLATRNNRKSDTSSAPVIIQQPVTNAMDSSQLSGLRSDIAAMRKEMDSMRRAPAPVPPTPVAAPVKQAAPPVYDASSFPVISVYFAMNSSTLAAAQSDKISPVVVAAQKNQNTTILLTGFTDPVGNAAVNKALAIKRMNHVKTLLTSKYGLTAAQVVIGEPEISRPGKKANPLDRRVDLRLQ